MSDALRGGSLMRLKGLVRKEFLQIARDPSSIAIAFLMPLFLLILFGYGDVFVGDGNEGGDCLAHIHAVKHKNDLV